MKTRLENVGQVAIDSGEVLIVDPCHRRKENCLFAVNNLQIGSIVNTYGDGIYQVYYDHAGDIIIIDCKAFREKAEIEGLLQTPKDE